MTNVLRLVRPNNDDTVTVLKGLLRKAMTGEVTGVALCYCGPEGAEDVLFTDAYKAHPDMAISAGLRLSVRLTQAQDEMARQ